MLCFSLSWTFSTETNQNILEYLNIRRHNFPNILEENSKTFFEHEQQ